MGSRFSYSCNHLYYIIDNFFWNGLKTLKVKLSAMTKAHDEFNTFLDIHIRKILFKLYKA